MYVTDTVVGALHESGLRLPGAPASETGAVKVWSEPLVLRTYQPAAPDKNPLFLERRVYQGSSGRVYPLPFIDRIATKATERAWQAIHIENEYIRVMLLPECGGRIHVGFDKTNGYDFFYRQNVIKPALVGLAGPWISGGVEFNWPQHHRPATFMPVDWHIERAPDGSCTVWCSGHDPMNRMKGMHGVCLRPDRSYIELRVRLYNRTPFTQTFLWWANAGVHVHEEYQSFFPPDVHWVADHANRATSAFPLCEGRYYGVDYGARARNGVPASEIPKQFVPPGNYPPNDLGWYANIPVPTSYMATESRGDFSGGYDHRAQAGVVHVANHHISPGKKQWTWGNHDFGYAWDRNLTDADGPYIELMAGVYTDNQPDFSFLAPGETKAFSQFWYPIQKIGPAQQANTEAALSLRIENGRATVGVCTTKHIQNARVDVYMAGELSAGWTVDIAPGSPFQQQLPVRSGPVAVVVCDSSGVEMVRYEQVEQAGRSVPKTATEPPLPADVETSDELFVIGTHLDQYRHATRTPQSYWHEAAHRDPGDSRANHSLGLWHIKRGEFVEAERCFRCSIARLTERNANPRDGEPFYSLGLALRHEGRMEEAYDAFYKATWNYGWRSAAHLALSEIGASRGDFATALDHVRLCLRTNADHTIARNLGVMLLRKLGREHEAEEWLSETLALDPLDYWAIFLAGRPLGDNQALLDVAFDLIRAGFFADAKMLLEGARLHALDGSVPMVHYTLGYIAARSGDAMAAAAHYRAATEAWPDYCFPSRLDELIVLEAALQTNAEDHRAHCYIGNWLYNHGRHEEAIEHWNLSAALHPAYSVVWRNLGIALFNIRDDVKGARAAFDNAAQANAADARVLYERDQLWKKTGQSVALRIAELERRIDLVAQRDDLTIELATLYNQSGQPHRAADLLAARRFQPWEGGEGLVLGQYVRTRLALGRRTLADGSAAVAIDLFLQALNPPENLGEAWHLLANRSQIYYWLGMACDAAGRNSEAHDCFTRAADSMGDFQEMSVRPYSEMTYYTVLALKRLNRLAEAMKLSRELLRYARILRNKEPRVDYFATSLPAMLLFKDDLQKRNQVTSLLLEAQAASVFGYRRHSRRLLRQLLQLDPNHNSASDFADELAINTPVAETTEP